MDVLNTSAHVNVTADTFLSVPSMLQQKATMLHFVEATSNDALDTCVCVVCVRDSNAHKTTLTPLVQIPNSHHLTVMHLDGYLHHQPAAHT